jgi:MFS family permease
MRVAVAYATFILTEYAVWIAMLVYAFSQGGATTAGIVALAQLVPAAIAAPLAAASADRRSPVVLLVAGYLVQAAGTAVSAVAVVADTPRPLLVYLGGVLASTAVATTRPAQAALVPALARNVAELTATNVVLGWVESISIMAAGALAGVTMALAGVGLVFGLCAVLLVVAALLIAGLRAQVRPRADVVPAAHRRIASAFLEAHRSGTARVLLGLLTAEFVVIGALDVLFVVLAIDVLGLGQSWAGFLNMAYGAGGVILGASAVLLLGRRLGPVIVLTAVLLGGALAVTAVASSPVAVVVLLAMVGGSRVLFDISTRTLLQRAVPANMVARLFGIAEGLSMAGLAVGALLAPALIALGGSILALVAVGAILPLVAVICVRFLVRIDQLAQVPVVEISLLRTVPIFRSLPEPALARIADALEPLEYCAGATIVSEGDQGDRFYAIAHGEVEIRRGGQPVALAGRGAGLGEVALLREGRRTATAVASTPVSAFALDRDQFLAAVNGHPPTRHTAEAIVRDLTERDLHRAVAQKERDLP